jgi:hypothetical protein
MGCVLTFGDRFVAALRRHSDLLGRLAGVAAGPVTAYAALRRPETALAVLAVLGVPVALTRADLLVLALVPLSIASNVLRSGMALLLAAVVLLVASTLVASHRATADLASPRRHGWVPVCVAVLAALLLLSVHPNGLPTVLGLPPDLIGLLVGLALVVLVTAVPADPVAVARTVTVSGAVAAAGALLFGQLVHGRLESINLGSNYLGALLSVPLATALSLARRSHGLGRLGWLAASGICLAAVLATHSRGAIVASGAGFAVALIIDRPLRQRILGAIAALAGGLILSSIANPLKDAAVGTRTANELTVNTEIRAAAARLAFHVAVEHPLRGIGYGRFPSFAATDPRLGIYINTHNDYLRLAAEAGVATLILFGALLVAALVTPVQRQYTPLRAAVAAGAVNLVFANTLANLAVSGLFWVSLGCLLAGRRHIDNHAAATGGRPQEDIPDGEKRDPRQYGGNPGRRAVRLRRELDLVRSSR